MLCSTRSRTRCSGSPATAPISTSGRRVHGSHRPARGDDRHATCATSSRRNWPRRCWRAIEHTLESGSVNTIEYELAHPTGWSIGRKRGWSRAATTRWSRSPATSPSSGAPRRDGVGSVRSRQRCGGSRRSSPGDAPPEVVFQTVTEEACDADRDPDGGAAPFRGCAARRRSSASSASRPASFYPGSVIKLETGAASRRPADRRSRAFELRGARRPVVRSSCGRWVSVGSVGVPDQRRGRDLGRAGRRAPRGGEPAARDRASPAGVRRARRPGGGERACARRALGVAPCASSRRATRSAAASSGTFTTGPSSGSSRSRSACGSLRPRLFKAPEEAAELLAEAARGAGRGADRATRARAGDSPGGADGAWARRGPRCARRAGASAGRHSTCACPSACRSPSRQPPTTSRPRRSRTSSSTPAPSSAVVRAEPHRRARGDRGGRRRNRRRRPRQGLGSARSARPGRDARRTSRRQRAESAPGASRLPVRAAPTAGR